ncbi:hypothetical protein DF054_23775 [Burkholderia cepacia]|nr:hypothetical protein DF055_21860 [Burkholderia cepacia]RRA04456.1 hypothetical protein DF054_23775 [Burkholderia cepacia]
MAGERLRSPVPTFRYANPVMCPPTPIGVGKRASTQRRRPHHASASKRPYSGHHVPFPDPE